MRNTTRKHIWNVNMKNGIEYKGTWCEMTMIKSYAEYRSPMNENDHQVAPTSSSSTSSTSSSSLSSILSTSFHSTLTQGYTFNWKSFNAKSVKIPSWRKPSCSHSFNSTHSMMQLCLLLCSFYFWVCVYVCVCFEIIGKSSQRIYVKMLLYFSSHFIPFWNLFLSFFVCLHYGLIN